MKSSAFETRTFKAGDGTTFKIESFTSLREGEKVECAKLSRKEFGYNPARAAMRLEVDDLGVLAMHAREAFIEAVGRKSMEVTPEELKEGDAIEGLGEVVKVERFLAGGSLIADRLTLPLVAHLADTRTSVIFAPDDKGEFTQLVDITRPVEG